MHFYDKKIPYNFKTNELVSFYQENKEEIVENRLNYKALLERINTAKRNLSEKLKIKNVKTPESIDSQELNSVIIVLKQLIKLLIPLDGKPVIESYKSPIEKIDIAKDSKLEIKDYCLRIPLRVSENELRSLIF